MPPVISAAKTAFLKYEIENGNAQRIKAALQDVCRLYRQGSVLKAESRNAFELLIRGMVLEPADEKVARWCLNALAQFGNRTTCTRYVELALKANEGKPEIIAAAVAAFSKMYNGRIDEVEALGTIDPVVRVLAALQNARPEQLDLSNLKINIDTSDPQVLKLALITVGLNRDIENLFDPRHSNGQIVKDLGQYPDDIVRQYCVWCVIENRRLSISDLGIPFSDMDKQPPNVQAKLLQLAAEKLKDPKSRHDIVYRGSYASSALARSGLAKGLLPTYYDGLEEITIGWFETESDTFVRELLAEHFARFSDDCPPYSDKALSIAEAEPLLLDRLLLGAEKTNLYAALKGGSLQSGTLDLFGADADLDSMFRGAVPLKKEKKSMKVLMLASAPIDQDSLRLDEEARDLREQLKLADEPKVLVTVDHRWAVRVNQIQMEVLNSKPNILHFSGHGDQGRLLFEDTVGATIEVSAEAIAELVELNSGIECLVLNACYSETVAKLAALHVKAVIGCNASIADDAAVAFTRSFYRALAHGETYEKAYRFAKNEVRLNFTNSDADAYVFLGS